MCAVQETRRPTAVQFRELCRLLTKVPDVVTPDWVKSDTMQLLSHRPIESELFPRVSFTIKESAQYRCLSLEDSNRIWEGIVTQVYPTLTYVDYSDEVLRMFELDFLELRDVLYYFADVINYFLYGSIPGLGSESSFVSKDKDKDFRKHSFGAQKLTQLLSSFESAERDLNRIENLPTNIRKSLAIIRKCTSAIENEVTLNRLRGPYAQRAMIFLSTFLGVRHSQISKAIESDLKRAGHVLRKKSSDLDRATSELRNRLDTKFPNATQLKLLTFLLETDFEKGGLRKNTYELIVQPTEEI